MHILKKHRNPILNEADLGTRLFLKSWLIWFLSLNYHSIICLKTIYHA